jgi:ribokinase
LSVLVVGTIALDSVKTPFGEKRDILGGSAVYAAVAASFFAETMMIGPVGNDLPQEHIEFLQARGIDLSALHRLDGPTFRWSGMYEYDMNQARTLDTKLNVLSRFDPVLPPSAREMPYVFLANIDPELQLKVIRQLKGTKLLIADTMNFWIESKREALHEVVRKVDYMVMNDGEIRQFMETPNLPLAARRLIKLGCKGPIIKKGALLFTDSTHFSAPSYPQERLRDPTGAGDSFGGSFIGYLAKTDDLGEANVRKAVIIGSVMASFNIEDFSLERMKRLKRKEIIERFEEVRRFSEFEAISAAHLT